MANKKLTDLEDVGNLQNGDKVYVVRDGNSRSVTISPTEYDDIINKPSTFPPSAHTHPISEINSLQTSLDGKASLEHTHPISDVTNLQSSLNSKSNVGHTHTISDITSFNVTSPQEGDYMTYNASSQKWINSVRPKIWTGSTTVGSNGVFSVTFPVGFFTSAPMVFAQARNKGKAVGDQNYASISSVTTTGSSGICQNSTTAGLLLVYVLTFASSGTVVDVVAIGN